MIYDGYGNVDASDVLLSEATKASNLNFGDNPEYTVENFKAVYSQFSSVSDTLLQSFVDVANSSLSYSKYQALWPLCMGLYVAHMATLFQKGLKIGDAEGLKTAKSVGDVSVSYDVGNATESIKGYSTLLTTIYGQQLAQYAKMAGFGGMTIW